MEAILSSVKKLFEFYIVSKVNTGDRTFDNLINTLLLSVIAIIFTKTYWEQWYMRVYTFVNRNIKKKNSLSINKDRKITYLNIDIIRDKVILQKNEYTLVTFLIRDYPKFWQNLYSYLCTNYQYLMSDVAVRCIDIDSLIFIDDAGINTISEAIRKVCTGFPDKIWPVFMSSSDEIICLKLFESGAGIFYKNKSGLKEFRDHITNYHIFLAQDKQKEINNNKLRKIIYPGQTMTHYIYPDRTFDKVVSKHKHEILAHLDDFVKVNSGSSDLNGFGSYNKGFIFYGPPGTGKTSILKAMANYLSRDLFDVDMRKLKKKEDFENLFRSRDYTQYIYVLEEIDCIPGVLSRDNKSDTNMDEKNNNISLAITDLKTEYTKKLELLTAATDESVRTILKAEIEKTSKLIDDSSSALTLDTILTILDGPIEMRGRIIIATTNHIKKLDDALIRPSRFDVKLELGKFIREEIEEMILKMFPNISQEDREYIKGKNIRENYYTPVELINICTINRHSIRKIIDIISDK